MRKIEATIYQGQNWENFDLQRSNFKR